MAQKRSSMNRKKGKKSGQNVSLKKNAKKKKRYHIWESVKEKEGKKK